MKRLVLAVCTVLMAVVFCAAAEGEKYGRTEISVRQNTGYEGTLNADGNGAFFVTTGSRRGELILHENGRFSYTPERDFSGKDYFGYRIRDSKGEVSEENTVIIRVNKG